MKGFSPWNPKYIHRLAEAWPDPSIVQQTVAQIPWEPIRTISDNIGEPALREYDIRKPDNNQVFSNIRFPCRGGGYEKNQNDSSRVLNASNPK
jgi:hypothetical protein